MKIKDLLKFEKPQNSILKCSLKVFELIFCAIMHCKFHYSASLAGGNLVEGLPHGRLGSALFGNLDLQKLKFRRKRVAGLLQRFVQNLVCIIMLLLN